MKTREVLIFLIIIIISYSCEDESNFTEQETEEFTYLHISHTRTNSNPLMDENVEQIDYKKYDMLWLGGDLASFTSEDDKTMMHVDSIFDLGSDLTLWALGNHDYTDLQRVQKFTNRPPYYSLNKNGITFVILDTQDSYSSIVGSQKEFLDGVLDTIQNSSHLIILHHKLIWMYGNPDLEALIPSISNGGFGDCFFCINPNNFYEDVYPKLVELKERGTEVICLAGDIGGKTKKIEYVTGEGIHFIASGIDATKDGNLALLFYHNVDLRKLEWSYVPIVNL